MKYIKLCFIVNLILHNVITLYSTIDQKRSEDYEKKFEVSFSSGSQITPQDMRAVRGCLIKNIFDYENQKLLQSINTNRRWIQYLHTINNLYEADNISTTNFNDRQARLQIKRCNDYIQKKELLENALMQEPNDFSDYFYKKNKFLLSGKIFGSIDLEGKLIAEHKKENGRHYEVQKLLPFAHQYLTHKHELDQITLAYELKKSQVVEKVGTVILAFSSFYILLGSLNFK